MVLGQDKYDPGVPRRAAYRHTKGMLGIMPVWRPGGDEWWIIETDKLPYVSKVIPTKEEAFNIALVHNKESGVNAVWVYGACMKRGEWEY